MKKRYWLAFLCSVLVLTIVVLLPFTIHTASAEDETTGQCGETLFWTFDLASDTLIISGKGDMYNYFSPPAPWDPYRSRIKSVILPDGLTSIGDYAFDSCKELESIIIPDSVIAIGEGSFAGCLKLLSITMPCSTKLQNDVFIPSFFGCRSIKNVHLTKGTGIMYDYYGYQTDEGIYIGHTPWAGSTSDELIITLDDGIKNIGTFAFCGCTGLTSITIPNSVTNIDDFAFYGCVGINSLIIPDNVTRIGNYAFYDCYQIPAIELPHGMTFIGNHAFCNCTGLAKITIPDSVTIIEQDAFSGCTRLTSVLIPACVTSIEQATFSGCTGLKSVTIPDGVENIGDYAFAGCTGLTTFTIPESVISIGNSAFRSCKELTEIKIPNSVTSIGSSAFRDCTELTEITIPDNLTSIEPETYCGCTGLTSITIPDSATSIGEYAFFGCAGIESVIIGNGVTSICDSAFSCCEKLLLVDIGNSVTSIGYYAFYGCANLTEITIPCSMTFIDYYAFNSCPELKDVYYEGTKSERESNLSIDYGNDNLLKAIWHYLGNIIDATVEWNSADVKYKGTTPYVIANGKAQTPRFTVKNTADGSVIDPANYDFEYRENINAGTGYVIVTLKDEFEGTCQGVFKIYLQPTTTTTVANVKDGIKLTWSKVAGADGYVIYRRAWSSTTNGWTDFVRWNNTKDLEWLDKTVYAGTRYQYGIKAYFNRRVDPVSGATIGGNVGDNYNLGEVGPLKTTVRITTRVLNSVTAGTKQMTVKWTASSVFTGYQIQYATNSTFTKNAVALKITNPKTAETVIKNLTKGTTYYVRIRSYHEFNGMTYFGEWSNVKSCKVK